MYRKTYVEIDCEKLENNIKEIKEKYNDYKYYIGVVKANAYGHGIESVKYMIKGGINYLAVSSLEEALKIRNIEKEVPILILEPISYDGIKVAVENNLTITIDNKEYFDKLLKDKINIKFHIKVDSGMNRFGFKNSEDIKYVFLNSTSSLYLEGIYTQLFSGVGETYKKELNKFKTLTNNIDLNKIEIVHLDRSLTLEQHDKNEFETGIRLGILMYGFNKQRYALSWKRKLLNKILNKKDNFVPSKLELKTVLKFFTEVIEIKDVSKDEIIGYGGMYDNKENVRIAILPYGFADFSFINKSYVYINGKKYNIVVNYMDITAVIIDDDIKVGDKVEIFGENISIREASRLANVNVYKLLTSITYRVPRIYNYKGKKKEVEY
ncbi:MAG: alanine racemase [Bacilli bacterium]|nr:alanine racemase [Bacilli bacterium]